MLSNYAASEAQTLGSEGKWSDNPKDPGGATMNGVTLRTYTAYRRKKGFPVTTKNDLRAITPAEVSEIYKSQYWDECNCDALPVGLDYAVFDFAINSGPDKACRELQEMLPGINVDGSIADKTLSALHGKTESVGIIAVLDEYGARRLAFMKRLKTWSEFGKGWSSRVAHVVSVGKQMAANASNIPTGDEAAGAAVDQPVTVDLPTADTTHETAKAKVGDAKVTENKTAHGALSTMIGVAIEACNSAAAKIQALNTTQMTILTVLSAAFVIGGTLLVFYSLKKQLTVQGVEPTT